MAMGVSSKLGCLSGSSVCATNLVVFLYLFFIVFCLFFLFLI